MLINVPSKFTLSPYKTKVKKQELHIVKRAQRTREFLFEFAVQPIYYRRYHLYQQLHKQSILQ